MNNEPTLENLSDYNTLKGEKKRVVWAVILSGIIIGSVYSVANSYFGTPNGEIKTHEKVGRIPLG